jgi:hypothetical protein
VLPLDDSNSIGELAVRLPLDVIATVLDITMVAWSYVVTSKKVSISSTEPEIAGYLGQEMMVEKNRRPGLKSQIRIEEEVGTRSSSISEKPEGRIDIKIIYSFDEAEYFGIECKRLASNNKRLTKKYVDEGVLRFVTGKYSPGHDWAAMIGFVIDGNHDKCIDLICDYLNQKSKEISMSENLAVEQRFGSTPNLYGTTHQQYGHKFLLRLLHLFLSIDSGNYSESSD